MFCRFRTHCKFDRLIKFDSDENGTEKNFESKEKKHRPGHVAEWLVRRKHSPMIVDSSLTQ